MDGVGVRVCFRLHYSNWSGNTGRSLHTSPIFRTNVRAHRPVSSSLPSLANKNIAGRPIFHCVFPYTLTPSPFAIFGIPHGFPANYLSYPPTRSHVSPRSLLLLLLPPPLLHPLLFRFVENKFFSWMDRRYNTRTFLSHQGVSGLDSRRESRN